MSRLRKARAEEAEEDLPADHVTCQQLGHMIGDKKRFSERQSFTNMNHVPHREQFISVLREAGGRSVGRGR